MKLLAKFAAALLADQPTCPTGLTTWNGSDPAQRFAVYRNNVISSLIDALADTYPVTRQLVGDDFFRGMARDYARKHRPHSPVLAYYGDIFADFVDGYLPAASVPYLSAVARLEWSYVSAFHAADACSVTHEAIANLMADPNRLPNACFTLHPSVNVISSSYAIVSLWGAHQDLMSLSEVDPFVPESALVQRIGLSVDILRIAPGDQEFIARLRRREPLGEAVGAATSIDSAFDLADCLGLLIRSDAIVGIHYNGPLKP